MLEKLLGYFFIENPDMLLRIVFAIILGSIIGLEREITNKSAGLRTQILVCLGSCIFTILSVYGFSTAVTLYPLGDPSRVAAQIVTGIGFIGAGTVLRQGLTVTGLTTASTLWMGAAIGMACGCGKISIAVVSTILAIAVLVLARMFEYKFIQNNQKHMKKIKISFVCREEEYDEILKNIENNFPDIIDFTRKLSDSDEFPIKISAKLYSCEKSSIININKKLSEIKDINEISVKEIAE